MADSRVHWGTCIEDDCIGVPLRSGGACWAHAVTMTSTRRSSDSVSMAGWMPASAATATCWSAACRRSHNDKGKLVCAAQFSKATLQG